jgi:aspartyl-tRNA(Asn)/glutamyl-tRNA(Gln) amidotransferase subunit B
MANINLTKFIEVDGVKYYPVIGLEIHAEMKTDTKMWCSCKNDPFEDIPNKNICPVCMAHPGTLPVPNKQAIQNVIKMGLACGSKIANFSEFDRKNYFYPDIPKGYQISQYKFPIVSNGSLNGVLLTRIHLEEDTATSSHDKDDSTLINFNRAGVPLMELVTEPVLHDSKTAVEFAKEVQLTLKYLGISDADIEKGHMRLEANCSISTDPSKFGTKVEVKNIGSFKSLEKAIEFEFKRHIDCIKKGERIVQETRGFDEASGTTKSQRSKENSEDYRYFPDPDISKLKLHEDPFFNPLNLKNTLPELPFQRRARYVSQGIKADTAALVISPSSIFAEVTASVARSAATIEPSTILVESTELLASFARVTLASTMSPVTMLLPRESFE